MENKNSSDMGKFFGKKIGKNCSVCGVELKSGFYSNKPLCFRCWKNELRGRNNIKDIMARTGETSISGKKSFLDKIKQERALKKNYKNEYVDYFGNRSIKPENKFICKCGCSKFKENGEYVTCILCLKNYKKKVLKNDL